MSRRARRRRDQAAAPPDSGTAAVPSRRRSGLGSHGARVYRRVAGVVRRHPFAIAAGLAVLHVALALLTFEPRPHTGGDNAAYITLGRSLLETGTYTELWDPAEPPHTKYPPVFPAVLALAMALGLAPWVQLKLVVLGFSAAAVALSFLWLRGRRRPVMAIGVGLILAVAPGILREGRWILSDVPFWAFSMLALWAFDRLRPGDRIRFAAGSVAVLLAFFTRSAGLPLVVAILGWLAWRRQWLRFGTLSAVVGVPAVLWWLRGRAFGPAGYVSEFWLVDPYLPALGTVGAGDMLTRVVQNAGKYVSIHMPVLLTGSLGAVLTVVAAGISLLALAGWTARLLRARHRPPGPAELFLPFYIGLIFVWPAVWSGERFLLPILPVVLYFAAEGLTLLVRRFRPTQSLAAGVTAVLLMLVLAAPGLVAAARVGSECTARYLAGDRYPCLGGAAWNDFFSMAELTGIALPDGAVVMSRKPRLLYVLSGGVKSVNYPLSADPDEFFATVAATGARHVLFDRLDAVSEIYLRPVVAARPAAFCLMRIQPETSTALFGIIPEAAHMAGAPDEDGTIAFPMCGPDYWRSADAQRAWEGT